MARSKVNNYIKLDSRFSRLGDQLIRFLEAQSSANQMISGSGARPFRFFRAGSSANQVISNYHIIFLVSYGQLDLFLIYLESIRTFSRILDTNKICLAFASELDFFMKVLLLTRKESSIVSYMCVCLAI